MLVVDDSLFMRTLVSDMLNSDPQIEVVDTAKDGIEAVYKAKLLRPDCITLDLVMPGSDGLSTLRQIMSECPAPCIILSAHSREGADITVTCLEAGAVGFVLKPAGELSLNIENVKHQLINEVKAASKARLREIRSLAGKKLEAHIRRYQRSRNIIVIGASTGGPQTVEVILSCLPIDFPAPIVVVQHVPNLFFAQSLSEHLCRRCGLRAKVVEDHDTLQAGIVYVASGGCHTTLRRLGNEEVVIQITEAKDCSLTPSIDLAMESAARIFERNTVGIILSGMGRDGVEGARAVKDYGGTIIVQDESSLIFGMPKAVIEAGLADHILPAGRIADAVMECLANGGHTGSKRRDEVLCLKI